MKNMPDSIFFTREICVCAHLTQTRYAQKNVRRNEDFMLKKIRCFYWYMRDRGKGKQVIFMAVVLCLSALSVTGLLVGNFCLDNLYKQKTEMQGEAASGAAVSVSESAEAEAAGDSLAVTGGGTVADNPEQSEASQRNQTVSVDTSGLDAFHGFMSEQAYEVLENCLKEECQKRGCRSANKLNFQQTMEGSFDVISFVLLSDGSVYQSSYNLKSTQVTVAETDYSEADITAMNEAQQKAEQSALEKQQKAEKKAKEKSGKKVSHKKSGKKATKKNKKSGKKTGKIIKRTSGKKFAKKK